MRSWHLFLLAALCSSAVSCRRDTQIDDEAAIRAATREWNAEAAKDLEKCLSFDRSAHHSGRGSPPQRVAKISVAPGTFQWSTAKVEVSRSGDLAYETGTFVLKTVDKNGQPTTTTGKYVCVWKKQSDGQWKVVADIDNPDS